MTDRHSPQKPPWNGFLSAARTAAEQREYAKAEMLYQQVLKEVESTFGKHHGEVGLILLELRQVYEQQNKRSKAELLYRRVQEIRGIYQLDQET